MIVSKKTRDRYLNNPHINLDDKRRAQLGLDGATEIPNDEPMTNKEVVVRKKKQGDSISPSESETGFNITEMPQANPEALQK